jgi:hypothetical protein
MDSLNCRSPKSRVLGNREATEMGNVTTLFGHIYGTWDYQTDPPLRECFNEIEKFGRRAPFFVS